MSEGSDGKISQALALLLTRAPGVLAWGVVPPLWGQLGA